MVLYDKVPDIAVSVWEMIIDFPVNVTIYESGDKMFIIKGYQNLMNIKAWMNEDIVVDICGESVKFKDFLPIQKTMMLYLECWALFGNTVERRKSWEERKKLFLHRKNGWKT